MKTFFKKYLSAISLVAFTSTAWAVGDMEICLQHERGVNCIKQLVQVLDVQDGRRLVQRDRFYGELKGTDSVIALSDGEDRIRVISTEKAQRDDEGNFFRYDVVKREKKEPIILPRLYDKIIKPIKEEVPTAKGSKNIVKKDESWEFNIFPFDDRAQKIRLTILIDNSSSWGWRAFENQNYILPGIIDKKNSTAQEAENQFFGLFHHEVKSQKEIIPAQLRNLINETYIGDMPFSNEVSVFGTVWKVREMWENKMIDIGGSAPNWTRLDVFPKMSEAQYKRMGFGNSYKSRFNNAFHYKGLLCFFPTDKFGESNEKPFTSRSLDIVAHEMGHYVFRNIAPRIANSNDIYAGAFNESFADCTAYFFLLQFQEMRDLIYEKIGGKLGIPSFFSAIGEGITSRDAAKQPTTPLANVDCKVHDLSEALTKAIYGILVGTVDRNIRNTKTSAQKISKKSFSKALENESNILMKVYLKAVLAYNKKYNKGEEFNFVRFGRFMSREAHGDREYFFPDLVMGSFQEQGFDLTNLTWQHPANCNLESKPTPNTSTACCATLAIRGL